MSMGHGQYEYIILYHILSIIIYYILLPLPKIPLPLRLLVSGHQVTVDPQRLWMVTMITMNMVNMVTA